VDALRHAAHAGAALALRHAAAGQAGLPAGLKAGAALRLLLRPLHLLLLRLLLLQGLLVALQQQRMLLRLLLLQRLLLERLLLLLLLPRLLLLLLLLLLRSIASNDGPATHRRTRSEEMRFFYLQETGKVCIAVAMVQECIPWPSDVMTHAMLGYVPVAPRR